MEGLIKEKRFNRNTLANFLLVIVTAIGVIVVGFELYELRVQNKITERSFRETFRPLLALKRKRYVFSIDIDKINTNLPTTPKMNNLVFTNEGKGVLIYLGYFSFFAREVNIWEKSFIKLVNDGDIKFNSNYIDSTPDIERFTKMLFPGEIDSVSIVYKDIVLDDIYNKYFYASLLYKDQANNLYESEYKIFL